MKGHRHKLNYVLNTFVKRTPDNVGKNGFIACSVNTQSRRFIASRKMCIAASSHRVHVYVKGPLELNVSNAKPFTRDTLLVMLLQCH